MIVDPSTSWEGPFPYDVLAPAGVTWATPQADVQDASFDLMERRMMTPRAQQALHELATVRRRLLVDLFLYDVDLATELPAARAEADPPTTAAEPGPPPPRVAELLDELIRFDV